jgi:hypothetical protein
MLARPFGSPILTQKHTVAFSLGVFTLDWQINAARKDPTIPNNTRRNPKWRKEQDIYKLSIYNR